MFWWELRRRLAPHRWLLGEWLGFFLLAILLTWPMIKYPSYAALGSKHADGMKHLWTLWWMRSSIWDYGDFPFHTDLINYPVGMDLYPIEPLNGFIACLFPWTSTIFASNMLVLLNMTLTGVIGAWFGRTLSESRWGGLIAGALLEGSAVMAFFVHVGVGELNHLWWLPLGLCCLLKARKTMEWKWFIAVTGCLVGAVLSCFYLGFFLALATLIWAVVTLWAGKDTPQLFGKYAAAAVLSLAIVLPVTKSFSASYKSGDVPRVGLWSYITQNHGQPVTDPPSARLEPRQMLSWQREAKRREDAAYGGGRYLGFFALGLAIVGLIRRPKEALPFLVVGVVGVLFACGTYVTVDGEEVKSNGLKLVMPIFWLNRALGYLAEPLNFPVRFMAVTATAVAAMAALSVRAPFWAPSFAQPKGGDWRWAVIAPLAVIEVMAGQMLDWPWQSFQPRDASALQAIRGEDELAVVDLALVARSDMENRFSALSIQMSHGKKSNAVPIERIEFFAREGKFFIEALDLFRALKPIYEGRGQGAPLSGDYRKDLALLQDAGFGWIVVSYRQGNERMPNQIVSSLNGLCGKAYARGLGLGAWRLPQVKYSQEELSVWKAEHAQAIKQVSRMTPGMAPPLP